MITREDYKKALEGYIGLVELAVPKNKSGKHLEAIATLYNYEKQQQAKDKAHEELERDVKRYFELDNKHDCTLREIDEWEDLERKLSKVGKEE